jgi:hypothetical protein
MNIPAVKIFTPPPLNIKEIKRYLGGENSISSTDVESLFREVENILSYKVSYLVLPLEIIGERCVFEGLEVSSKALSKNLFSCDKVLLFAVTVGIEFDRILVKYSKISPSKAVVLQAIGAERAESLCDTFVKWYERENALSLAPRFSPGYADLPLEAQRDILKMLSAEKNLGITLGEGFLMTPSKSVTAFAGIKRI